MNLDDYRHKNPLLLLFVPDPGHDEYVQQWQILYKHAAELQEHGLLVASLFESDVGDIEGDPIEEADSAALRRQWRVKRDHVVVLVIDKDGKEKLRTRMPADIQAVINVLD